MPCRVTPAIDFPSWLFQFMYMTRGPNTASTVLVPYGEPNHYGLVIEMKAKTTQMLNCYSASFI